MSECCPAAGGSGGCSVAVFLMTANLIEKSTSLSESKQFSVEKQRHYSLAQWL